MAVSTAPSSEAMQAIISRINSGTAYALDVAAEYAEIIDDTHEDVGNDLRVDVTQESEQQLIETLDVEDRTSHQIVVWIRQKVKTLKADEIDPLKLIVRQIWQRVNNYDTTDGRVRVWEVDADPKEIPNKDWLRQSRTFVAALVLRVEVEASA